MWHVGKGEEVSPLKIRLRVIHKKRKKKKERKERERKSCRERDSTFSLSFPTIGPTVSIGVREKVHPHDKGFA